nr:RNA-directed DNA polymerase, eukaryota, nucleotide-binding alpha-beta plait domain protein [Tanacetum cinerariifolium]
MGFPKSNADHTKKISQSVFVTNFPDSTNSGDLWKVCSAYETVIDVFIPNKKAKYGKRFAFVRFIKVSNLVLLVNLYTIWIGRHHLYANQVCFERPHKPNFPPLKETFGALNKTPNSMRSGHLNRHPGSYASVANGPTLVVNGSSISPSPALVLDDSYVIDRDLSRHAMGCLIDINFFSNLQTILFDEGFSDVKLLYLGGMWVLFEFDKEDTKANLMQHTSIKSWFHIIRDAKPDFVSDECIVWVDIEGVPLHVWSRETFTRIDDESSGEGASDDEVIPETNFDDNSPSPNHCGEMGDPYSQDPFKIYNLLKKKSVEVVRESSPSLTHPPGFTPDCVVSSKANGHETEDSARESTKSPRFSFNAKVINSSQKVHAEVNSDYVGPKAIKYGGSALEVMEEMIRVGQLMGESLGYSGGILCVWEASVFKKDYVTISDNFVAIYGTWLPSSSKILFVAIYAPQAVQFCIDRHLSDHCPILLHEAHTDFGPTTFRFYHSWFKLAGFDDMVEQTWHSFSHFDGNMMWIRGTFSSAKASVLVNGSPSNEFYFHCGLKQGDPLAPYLFILVMKSLHMSFSRVVDAGLFKGVRLQGSLFISHLFYVNDALFLEEWSDKNLELNSTLAKIKDQMTSVTSLCEMACQVVQKKLEEKQLEEERAAKAKYWKLSVCYDDDDDDERSDSLDDNIISGLPPFSAITPDEPVLSTEEPDNSLSMGDEHLDTIPAMDSDEFIKSSVETLIPIPKFSSIDADSFSVDNIDYVEASPLDYELVSSEVMEIVIPEVGGIDDDILLMIKDDILREKLLNVNLLISKIEALNANPTPSSDCKTNSGSPTTHSDSSLYASFMFDLSINPFPPADRSDSYELTDELILFISAPEYDCFLFKVELNLRDFTKDVVDDISPMKKPQILNALPTHPTLQLNMKFQPSS